MSGPRGTYVGYVVDDGTSCIFWETRPELMYYCQLKFPWPLVEQMCGYDRLLTLVSEITSSHTTTLNKFCISSQRKWCPFMSAVTPIPTASWKKLNIFWQLGWKMAYISVKIKPFKGRGNLFLIHSQWNFRVTKL